jgi:radical SAM protein with 4Fe4S-binding SPASM domain
MIRPIELSNIYTDDPCDYAEFLLQNWFIVPENFQEDIILKTIRQRAAIPITDTYLDHPSHFTILTTSACNARCFYCYEQGLKSKVHMKPEMAEKIASYIIHNADRRDEVELDWFGGEPTFNSEAIDIISNRVAAAGINFRGSMISNGYLFDDDMVLKAKYEWRLVGIQITLDGTEEIYNKTKAYIYKDCESPFKRVIGNIHKLSEAGIEVSIRMNCDKHNFDNLIELVDFLKEEFKESSNIHMYVWPVFEEGFTRTEEERKTLWDNLSKIDEHIYEFTSSTSHGLMFDVKSLHCMIDSNNSICIFPKGEIGICEHYLDSKFVSHIDNPTEKNWDVIREWRQYVKQEGICDDCPLQPLCLRVEGCPDEHTCDEYQKEFWINHYKRDMRKRWQIYKENPPQETQQQCCKARPDCPSHTPYCSQHNPEDE